MVRLTLATGLLTTAFALAPSVGTVVKGNRKITVIGTAHTPSRRQREEVEALIAEVKPDAVLVELDAERLEFAWNQPEEAYGGELAAAVRAARRIDAPVVLGDACRPLPAVVEARPLFDLERTRRAWRLLVKKPVAIGFLTSKRHARRVRSTSKSGRASTTAGSGRHASPSTTGASMRRAARTAAANSPPYASSGCCHANSKRSASSSTRTASGLTSAMSASTSSLCRLEGV